MTTKDIIPVWENDEVQYNNYQCFPNHYRMLIVGSSGDGKTVILNRLLLTKMLDYDIIFLFSPSILQTSYQIMIKGINAGLKAEHIFGLYDQQQNIHNVDYAIQRLTDALNLKPTAKVIASDDPEAIPKPEDIAKSAKEEYAKLNDSHLAPKTIIIIDDAICSSQKAINKIFVYGRTYGINCVYLCQAFFQTEKGATRTNTNAFILFRQSDDDLKRIHSRVSKGEITRDDFIDLCKKCWNKSRGFLVITRTEKGTQYIDGEDIVTEIRSRQVKLYNS